MPSAVASIPFRNKTHHPTHSTEYAAGEVVADLETREGIKRIGIREVARQLGVDRETVGLIANGSRVKAKTLARVVAFICSVPN
jgi:transcriptional regulator with XRE-family HTH domain